MATWIVMVEACGHNLHFFWEFSYYILWLLFIFCSMKVSVLIQCICTLLYLLILNALISPQSWPLMLIALFETSQHRGYKILLCFNLYFPVDQIWISFHALICLPLRLELLHPRLVQFSDFLISHSSLPHSKCSSFSECLSGSSSLQV